MTIVVAPKISKEMVENLKTLISDYNILPKKEFLVNLLPKHHFMIHYPRVIELTGSLVYLWTMRFEIKLGYFKF